MKRWLLDTSALLTLRDDEPGRNASQSCCTWREASLRTRRRLPKSRMWREITSSDLSEEGGAPEHRHAEFKGTWKASASRPMRLMD
jgi:hypothetical protein